MPKGIFTQGICVLLERTPSLDDVEELLDEFDILHRVNLSDDWVMRGPSLILGYRPDVHGMANVDIVDRPWPDEMGEDNDEMIRGGCLLGHFGPFASPGGLHRAAHQCWAWEEGATMPLRHNAFVRIRTTYAFGYDREEGDPIIPNDYEPVPELQFVTKVASRLLYLPRALCYFNPNGELLLGQDELGEALDFAFTHDLPPLDAWSNVRAYGFKAGWTLMDTVGNRQLDIHDIEACFHTESYDTEEVEHLLRGVSLDLLENGEAIDDGHTAGGPGGVRWQCHKVDSYLVPHRRVLRWLPMDDRPIPPGLLDAADSD